MYVDVISTSAKVKRSNKKFRLHFSFFFFWSSLRCQSFENDLELIDFALSLRQVALAHGQSSEV